jgi:hypothetical protein
MKTIIIKDNTREVDEIKVGDLVVFHQVHLGEYANNVYLVTLKEPAHCQIVVIGYGCDSSQIGKIYNLTSLVNYKLFKGEIKLIQE